MRCVYIRQDKFPNLVHLRASFQRKLYLFPHILCYLYSVDSLPFHYIQEIILVQRLYDLLGSNIKLLLFIEEILIQVLLDLLLLLHEVLLLELDVQLMLLEGRHVLHGWGRVVVDDHSIHVVLQDVSCRLRLTGKSIARVETLQLGVLDEDGLAIVGFVLFPLQGILVLYLGLADAKGNQFGRLFVLHNVIDGIKTVEHHFSLAF
jgi:hypothetical protein